MVDPDIAFGPLIPDFGTQGGFLDPVNLATNPEVSWRDRERGFASRFNHSKLQRQHYQDHWRSSHALNPTEMFTCWDCHASHEPAIPSVMPAAPPRDRFLTPHPAPRPAARLPGRDPRGEARHD